MAETYTKRVHTENAGLDIGEDIGALVIYTGQEMLGNEIEVCPKGNHTQKTHTNSFPHSHGIGSSQRLAEVSTTYPRDQVQQGGGKPRPYYTRPLQADPSYSRGDPDLPPRYRNGKVVSA